MECPFDNLWHLAEVVGAPPNTITLTTVITERGIVRWSAGFGNDFQLLNRQFEQWVAATHPDDVEKVQCCGGSTIEEARADGEIRARYADEWAAYLEENGCNYEGAC